MIYWIWLTQLPVIGPVTARYLIEELKDAENIYKADAGHLAEIPGLSEQQKKHSPESFIGTPKENF